MVGRLLILFLVLPLIELYLLLRFASVTSIPTTICVVILTGVIGSWLAARQGAQAIRNFQLAASQGRIPGAEVVDGILIAFAAALLLSPGLLTDTLGIVLLIPWSRKFFREWLIRRFTGTVKVVKFTPDGPLDDERTVPGGDTVDGTFHRTTQRTPESHFFPRS